MANIEIFGTLVRNDDGTNRDKIVQGSQVEGGYFVCSAKPTSGTWQTGQLCYCTGDSKFYQYNGSSWAEKTFGTNSVATTSALGLVKSTTTGTTASRDYAVEVKSDGTMKVNVPWTDTNTDTNTWRKVQLNGTDKLSTGTSTNPLNIKAGSNMTITESNGTFTFSATDTNTDTNQKVKAGSVTFEANDEINIEAGSNVTVTGDATNKKITIAATDTTYSSKTAASGGTAVSLVTTGEKYTWNSKQDAISDLATIINNASTGATHAGTTHAPSDAQKNVQSDWNATSGDAFIKNKPTIPTVPTNYAADQCTSFTSDSGTCTPLAVQKGAKMFAYAGTLTSYSKASSASAVAATDTISAAIGKLEKALDNYPTTDTKNTAGSTNSTSKIYLVGATSQAANPQTYSNSSCYASGGYLYSNSKKVSVEGHTHDSEELTITNNAPTLSWGNTSTVGTIGGVALTVKMPANPNEPKVKQTNTSGTSTPTWYNVLFSVDSNTTTEKTNSTYKSSKLIFDPYNGQLKATSFYATSDKRLKENIKPYQPKKSILDLPVVEFNFKDSSQQHIGCIAQDLQEICPEIVTTDDKGYLSINEGKLVYLLLDEVKKLRKELEEVKGK